VCGHWFLWTSGAPVHHLPEVPIHHSETTTPILIHPTMITRILHIPDEKSKTGLSAKEYLWRLVAAGGFLLICSFCNVFSSVVAAYRTPNIRIMNSAGTEMSDARILPDFGHYASDYVQQFMDPTIAYYWETLDPNFYIAHIMHSFVFLLFIHPQRLVLARRTCGIVGYIFLARSICVLCTSMPDAHRQCYEQFGTPDGDYKDREMLPEAIWTTFSTMAAFSDSVTCGDMIFSGHMVMIVCGGLFFSKYCNSKDMEGPLMRKLPKWFCLVFRSGIYILCILGAIAIIKSRLHYTVDVIIALYFTMNSWNVYHRTSRDVFNQTDIKGSRMMEYSPFNRFFGWLESPEMQVQDAYVWEAARRSRKPSDSFAEEDDVPLMDLESDRQV
jgi:hypothetical protein